MVGAARREYGSLPNIWIFAILADSDMMEDHSFSHHDCLPYYLRTGDKWTPIDYTKHPSHWMKPLEPGPETGLVEIPSNWYLDDVSSTAALTSVTTIFWAFPGLSPHKDVH